MKTNTKTQATHTPGPWKHGKSAGGKWGVWVTENWYGVLDNTAPGIDAKANARLIAAAPDLLKDLEDLVSTLGTHLPYEHPALVNARATIAKAKG